MSFNLHLDFVAKSNFHEVQFEHRTRLSNLHCCEAKVSSLESLKPFCKQCPYLICKFPTVYQFMIVV